MEIKKAYGFIEGPDFSQVKENKEEEKGNTQPVIEIEDYYHGASGLGVTTDIAFIKGNSNKTNVEEGR
ncbi:MAG TPA: hypothetical protein VF185_03525 [Patescibacteria group bacterium]